MAREFSKLDPHYMKAAKARLNSDAAMLLCYEFFGSLHQNCCGCAQFPRAYMEHDLKWGGTNKYPESRTDLLSAGLIAVDEDTEEVFMVDWFETNPPTNLNHYLGIVNQMQKIRSKKLRALVNEKFQAAAEAKGFTQDRVDAELAERAQAQMERAQAKHRLAALKGRTQVERVSETFKRGL